MVSGNGRDEDEKEMSKKEPEKGVEMIIMRQRSKVGKGDREQKTREMNPWAEAVSECYPPGIIPVPTEVSMPLVCAVIHW